MSLSCHFHTLLPFTCGDDSCLLHVGVPTIVNSAIASLGPSVKAYVVYRLLLNVSDASLFVTRASRTSDITFSAAVHVCSS